MSSPQKALRGYVVYCFGVSTWFTAPNLLGKKIPLLQTFYKCVYVLVGHAKIVFYQKHIYFSNISTMRFLPLSVHLGVIKVRVLSVAIKYLQICDMKTHNTLKKHSLVYLYQHVFISTGRNQNKLTSKLVENLS